MCNIFILGGRDNDNYNLSKYAINVTKWLARKLHNSRNYVVEPSLKYLGSSKNSPQLSFFVLKAESED